MLDELSDKLSEFGISPENVGTAAIIYILVSTVWSVILLILCYFCSPIKNIIHKIPLEFVQRRIKKNDGPGALEKYLKWLPDKLRGKAAVSVCEMLIMKSITAPFIVPVKIWVSVYVFSYL